MLSRQEFAETEQKRKEEEKILDETLHNSLVLFLQNIFTNSSFYF